MLTSARCDHCDQIIGNKSDLNKHVNNNHQEHGKQMIAADGPICLHCWLWYIYNNNNWFGILMLIEEDSQESDKHNI